MNLSDPTSGSSQSRSAKGKDEQSASPNSLRIETTSADRAAPPVPAGNGWRSGKAPSPTSNPTGSDRFPYRGGTGNQSNSGDSLTGSPCLGTGEEPGTSHHAPLLSEDDQFFLPSSQQAALPRASNPERAARGFDRLRPPVGQLGLARPKGDPPVGSSWLPEPLAEIVAGLQDGSLDRPHPTIGRLADGTHWLYAEAVNGLAGESGSGKTWTALATVAAELDDGNNVVYIDLEDSPIGIVSRLLDLGVPADVVSDATRLSYVRPEEAFRDDVRSQFWSLLDALHPTLVVLDSTGESMALEGTDPNSDDAVATWFKRVAAAIAKQGPAVLLLDHLPKASSGASSPIGSQRKRAAISGVQMIQTVPPKLAFAKGRAGQAVLTCTKDRHGHFVTGDPEITLTVNPDLSRGAAGVSIGLSRVSPDDDWAPTREMLRIIEVLEDSQSPQSTNAIAKGAKGKRDTVLKALAVLAASGYVATAKGPRNSTLYELVKPYRLGDPIIVPDHLKEDDLEPAKCEHPWHDSGCNPSWCHPHHHGECNRRMAQGYVLDDDGTVLSEPQAGIRYMG